MLCVNCNEPLKLDSSLSERYPEWQALSKGPARSSEAQITSKSKQSEYESVEDADNSGSLKQFAILNDPSQPSTSQNLSNAISVTANLFDIMSSDETPLEHPVCQECANKLLDFMDSQLKTLDEECSTYRSVLEDLKACEEELDDNCLKTELEQLESEESALLSQLAQLDVEEKQLKELLEEEKRQLDEVEKEEEKLWYSYRNNARKLLTLNNEKTSLHNQLNYAELQLDKLQKTNIFNLAFHIWHKDTHFGTINGLRLGRLPNITVEWSEINAAWGQTVLLLSALARKMGLTFERYVLVPSGNYSYIKCSDEDDKELPLYCTGGYKFFWDTKFDLAMVAFLDCLQQLKLAIEKGDNNFCMPYKMAKDKIYVQEGPGPLWNEYSVKIQFNSEERWTKAMKCMLTNLKWALAWVSSLQT